MTDPDPRTDLAGYLGLTEEQARICRQSAEDGYTGIRGKVGARLVAQDQADTPDPEPDDGQLWSLGWTDANGEPVLTDLSRDDIEGFCEWVEDDRYVSHAISSLARSWQAALPAPKPPWKSPLDNLPDLTEEQCREAVEYLDEGNGDCVMAQIGRALIAAGWAPEEEA